MGRRRWSANLTLALTNTIIVRFAVPLGTYGAAELAVDRGWGLFNLTNGSPALEFVAAVLLMDLVVYLQHASSTPFRFSGVFTRFTTPTTTSTSPPVCVSTP